MKSLLSKLQSPLGRILLIGLMQFAFWLGLSLTPLSPALAAATPEADRYEVDSPQRQSYNPLSGETTQGGVDLQKAAEKAERLSNDVFSGQETTMQMKGKTQQRNEAILHARETASGKLKEMAETARSADAPADLSPKESRVLKHYQGQQ